MFLKTSKVSLCPKQAWNFPYSPDLALPQPPEYTRIVDMYVLPCLAKLIF